MTVHAAASVPPPSAEQGSKAGREKSLSSWSGFRQRRGVNVRLTLLTLLLPVSFSLVQGAPPASAVGGEASFVPLFNGRDLSGWKQPAPNPFWSVVNGVLVGQNDEKLTGSMLWTEKTYGNFIFECDVRWDGEIDSGFMLRKPELQLQIGISGSLKRDMTGSFYTGGKPAYPEEGQAPHAATLFTPGEWTRFRLEARGNTFTVLINGKPASQYTNPAYATPAPIGLQVHPKRAMKVEFRNVRIVELP